MRRPEVLVVSVRRPDVLVFPRLESQCIPVPAPPDRDFGVPLKIFDRGLKVRLRDTKVLFVLTFL